MVGGEEGKDAGMGQRKPAPSIKIHNPTFLLSQVIFGDRAGPSPMFRSYHLPLVTTRPAGAPQPPQSYHPRPQGLTSGHRANWSCYIRGGEAQGPIYHRCSTRSIRSLSLSLSSILGGFPDRRFTPSGVWRSPGVKLGPTQNVRCFTTCPTCFVGRHVMSDPQQHSSFWGRAYCV